MLHDIRVRNTQYNLQMGFAERLDRKLSVGLLHIGFMAEECSTQSCFKYDLLAGGGMKNETYKARITNRVRRLITIRAIRNKLLGYAYKHFVIK